MIRSGTFHAMPTAITKAATANWGPSAVARRRARQRPCRQRLRVLARNPHEHLADALHRHHGQQWRGAGGIIDVEFRVVGNEGVEPMKPTKTSRFTMPIRRPWWNRSLTDAAGTVRQPVRSGELTIVLEPAKAAETAKARRSWPASPSRRQPARPRTRREP